MFLRDRRLRLPVILKIRVPLPIDRSDVSFGQIVERTERYEVTIQTPMRVSMQIVFDFPGTSPRTSAPSGRISSANLAREDQAATLTIQARVRSFSIAIPIGIRWHGVSADTRFAMGHALRGKAAYVISPRNRARVMVGRLVGVSNPGQSTRLWLRGATG